VTCGTPRPEITPPYGENLPENYGGVDLTTDCRKGSCLCCMPKAEELHLWPWVWISDGFPLISAWVHSGRCGWCMGVWCPWGWAADGQKVARSPTVQRCGRGVCSQFL